MARKRYKPEEIVCLLRQAEVLHGSALAASNHAETRAWSMASSRSLPKYGVRRFLM